MKSRGTRPQAPKNETEAGLLFFGVYQKSKQVVEFKRRYDGDSVDVEGCKIEERNQGTTCSVEIEVDE